MAQFELQTAAKNAEDDNEFLEISLLSSDGKDMEVFEILYPTETQIAIFLSSYNDGNVAMIGAAFKFLNTLFGKEDSDYLIGRLNDRNDEFELRNLTDLLLGIIQEVSQRPTRRSTGSTPSRRAGGPKLTDRLPPKAQTRSRSPRTASATSSTPGPSSD